SALVLSSFAMQKPANTTQPAEIAMVQSAGKSGRAQHSSSGTSNSSGQSAAPQNAAGQNAAAQNATAPAQIFGYRDFSKQYQIDQQFLAIPSPQLAEQHLKVLTQAPHIAGSLEDKATAEYVAKQFSVAGL